jgi:hypothetical protein
MELMSVQPREFLFHFGVSHSDLLKFKIILDNMVFNYDSSQPGHVAAKEYLETKLYPVVVEGLKAVEESDG